MSRSLEKVLAELPAKRRARIERRAGELATLKDLRQAVERTQQEMAASLGVGQDTISRIERRSDMLLSTLRRYVEAMGGRLELVAQFPKRDPVVIDQLSSGPRKADQFRSAARSGNPARGLALLKKLDRQLGK